MRRPICLLPTLPLLLCGCQETAAPPPLTTENKSDLPEAEVLGLFGGANGWQPLVDPTHVEAFRVEGGVFEMEADAVEEPAPDPRPTLAGYPIISGPVEVNQEIAGRLARVLRDRKAYGWDYAKACGFTPGVAIRFVGAESTTELLLCFSCDNLEVVHDGKRVGYEDTDAIRESLARTPRAGGRR